MTVTLTAVWLSFLFSVGFEPDPLDEAQVGDKVEDFELDPIICHDGRTRLSELYGQPVVIGGWKMHLVTGCHAAFAGGQLVKRHGDNGLILIMEDRSPWKGREAFIIDRMRFWIQIAGFLPWLTNNPDDPKVPDLPIQRTAGRTTKSMILIGVDGTLLAEGEVEEINDPERRSDFRFEIQRLLDEEIQKRRKGWGEDRYVRRARKMAFGEDDLAGARKVLERAGIDEEPERAEAWAELDRHFEARMKSIRFYLDEARYLDAREAAKRLSKSVRGHDPWEEALDTVTAVFDEEDIEDEMALDRQLSGLLRVLEAPMTPANYNVELIQRMRAFIERYEGTKVGARAEKLAPLLESLTAIALGIKPAELERRVGQ